MRQRRCLAVPVVAQSARFGGVDVVPAQEEAIEFVVALAAGAAHCVGRRVVLGVAAASRKTRHFICKFIFVH